MTHVRDVYPDGRVSLREVGLRDGLQLVKLGVDPAIFGLGLGQLSVVSIEEGLLVIVPPQEILSATRVWIGAHAEDDQLVRS